MDLASRTEVRLLTMLAVGSLIVLPLAAGDDPEARASRSEVQVTYVSGESAYIDGGSNQGFTKGELLDVVRDGSIVGRLRIKYLSSDRSSCAVLEGDPDAIRAGSVSRPSQTEAQPTPAPATDPAVTSIFPAPNFVVVAESPFDSPTVSMARSAIRPVIIGRVGFRYLGVRDRTPGGTAFSQPGLDLRLDANQVANGRLDFAVDIRSRMTYRSVAGENRDDSQNRVYRLGASIHDRRGRFRLAVGRQFSPSLASVSTFDGAIASFQGQHVGVGVFGGTQPDPIDYGYSDQIKELGGFFQFHNRPGSKTQWTLTTGAVGSYQDGEVNREYGYFQVLIASRLVSLFATQEIDYNRGWKLEAGEKTVDPTSTFVNLGVRVTRTFDIRAGYDNRRNIRLYRDLITPETDFDDTFRQGYWAGFTQRFLKRFRIGLSAKRSTNQNAGDADTYTLLFGASQIARRLSLYYRGSVYSNSTNEGLIQTLTTTVAVTRNLRLNVNGGLRRNQDLVLVDQESELVWYGIGGDLNFARNWFAQLSVERTEGELENNEQIYFSTTYRF